MDRIICPACGSKDTKIISTYTSNGYVFNHCVVCNVIFANPMKPADKEWYETSEWYTIPSEISEDLRWYEITFLKELAKYAGKRVLNIGCGRNIFLKRLKVAGFDVSAVDINEKTIEFTKKTLGIEDTHVSDAFTFIKNYTIDKFDMIIFFEVLEHLENPQDFVKNLKTVLKNDGYIVLSVPNRERLLPSKDLWDCPPHHLTRWSTKSLINFLEINGYVLDKIIISPLSAEDLLVLFRIYFGTLYLENRIRNGDKRLRVTFAFKVLFKFRVIFYNVLAIIVRLFIKNKGLNLYAVARVKNI